MATLKCLACGHDNNVGDEWCSSCSSSLNLRLCSACEAINAHDAERCHGCNAEFRIEPEVGTFEMATEQARKPSRRSVAVLAVLPLLAAGAAYCYFYAASPAAEAPRTAPMQVAPTQAPSIVEAARKSEPAPDPEAAAPTEPARPQTVEVKQAPVVSGKIAAPRTAAAPARSTRPAEPKRTTATVTHTRGADAASRTAVDAPGRTAAPDVQATTAVTTLPAAAASAPAANAAILPVSERVTHIKADPVESAATTAAPAAATQVRTVPAEAGSDERAGCSPAVAALALCKSR
jgi:hypothetical protein